MNEQQALRWGEIQYLKGRLDELYEKAVPNTTDLHGSRMLDVRVGKYLEKLKKADEISYYSYLVEMSTRKHAKDRSQRKIKAFLEDILEKIEDSEVRAKISSQIYKYPQTSVAEDK
jgi:TPP-dependent 2-oxoacid decarboxylase